MDLKIKPQLNKKGQNLFEMSTKIFWWASQTNFGPSYFVSALEGNPWAPLFRRPCVQQTYFYLFYFFPFFSLFAWVSMWQRTEREYKRFCYLRRNKGYFLRNNECSCGPRERIDVIKGLVSLFGHVPLEVA